jgi:hypothetical protein
MSRSNDAGTPAPPANPAAAVGLSAPDQRRSPARLDSLLGQHGEGRMVDGSSNSAATMACVSPNAPGGIRPRAKRQAETVE